MNIGVDTPGKFGYTVTSPKILVYKYLFVTKFGNEMLQSKGTLNLKVVL